MTLHNPVYASLSNPFYRGLRSSLQQNPVFPIKLAGLKTIYVVDHDRGHVTIRHEMMNQDFRMPVHLSFQEYLRIRYELEEERQWRRFLDRSFFETGEVAARGGGLGIDIPIPIKSEALQKIFGGTNVGLQVTGNITIDGGLRHEKRSEVKTALNRQSNFNFKMKQTQRFTVKGNIGEKVNVFVDQDSERPFEFNNAVRLEYRGFDDEVIESITAGNVSLSLPASRFVTFSAKNTGLFGIKSDMRMGHLKMTMIASQEKGQKKKLSISGGATDDESRIDDYSYRGGTYFFLDEFYRQQYPNVDSEGAHIYDPSRALSAIEVYKSEANYQFKVGEGAVRGWATAFAPETNPALADTAQVDQNHYRGFFIRMEQTEYFVEKDLGYIALEQPLRKGEVLAVAYRDTSQIEVGDVDYVDTGGGVPIILRLLRTKNPQASDANWDLEWKNVYYLGTRNIDKEGFDLKIYFKPPSGDPQESLNIDGTQVSYLQLLGLDRADINGNLVPDNVLDDNPNIINWARGELIFPELQPFNSDVLPQDKQVSAIYDTTDQQFITSKSRFYISTSARIRQTSYSLGFNVIENSEEILLNGRRLESGRDYIIDYFTGNLTLLDEQAADPNAGLEISYESNQLFQIDQKTIFGTRWDYELLNNSFIGGTFLYLNQSTLDQKVRIGQDGPMNNLVWNLNGAFNFEPYVITRALNALPFVQTKEPSLLKFEGEIAEIVPNPNSRDNPSTGDANGVVYIDDFEAAKRETPLGVLRKQWTKASVPKVIPGDPAFNFLSDVEKDARRGSLIWYNPYEQVSIKEIWPNQDVNPNVPQSVHVMTLRFDRANLDEAWAGVMRYLSAGYADQSTSKFLEVWVQGNGGRMHFEFGQISEDAIPNGVLNTEDRIRNGIRNGILDDDEDVGLDGVPGDDDLGIPGDDGDDDWFYQSQGFDYDRINGTEGNLNDEGGRFPDTEDLNNNGDVDLRNDYFSFSFNLDPNHPDAELIAGEGGEGFLDPYNTEERSQWRMYRLPLAKPDTSVGNPQWTNIEYVRIWVDEVLNDQQYFRIAKINLVGSEWKERGLVEPGAAPDMINADDDSTVRVTVVNTYDNPDYVPPPGVQGERDQITKIVSREQALVLKVADLAPGYTGVVEKTFFKAQNYVNYKKMKMFAYGEDPFSFHIASDTSKIEMSFRFGADNLNYYEFKEKVYAGWAPRNEMILDFEELTGLKNRTDPEFFDKDGNVFIRTDDGDTIRVVGQPSLTNVRQLVVAVHNLSATESFTGEVWLNELRLSDVKKDKGRAARARMTSKLADVGNLNIEVSRRDDDFRTVNERFGKGNNQLRGSVNASMQLDRFLPSQLGLSIPITVGYDKTESSPKYFPGSDILVSPKTASDSLLQTIKTISKKNSYSIGLKRRSSSRNPLVKFTLDAISLNYSYSETFTSNSIVERGSALTYSGNLAYTANFNSKVNVKPLGWLGGGRILGTLTGLGINPLPQRMNYRISFNRRLNNKLNRNGLFTDNYAFVITQNGGIAFQPFSSLSFDFTRTHANDLRDARDDYSSRILSGKLGPLTSISQAIKGQFNPNLSNWLKFNLTMNTTFRYSNNLQQKTLGKSAQNQVNYGAGFTLTPKLLVQSLSGGSGSPQTRRRPTPRKADPEQEEEEEQTEEDSGGGFSIPNPLKLLAFVGNNLQPVSLRFSRRVSSSRFALQKIPGMDYQIGRTFNPGPIISQNVGTNRGSFVQGFNFDASSGLDIRSRVRVTLKYAYDNSATETTLINGNVSDSRLKLGEERIPFPDWTVRWSGLEKIKFLSRFVQRLTLEHGRTGKLVTKWQERRDNLANESFTSNFRPLIGANISWKGSLNSTIQYNQSFGEVLSKRGGAGGTRKKRSDLTISVTFAKRGGLRIPLPFLKNKVIKNNIDFAMNFVKSVDTSEQKRGAEGVYQEHTRNEKWSLTPKLNYSFSSTVRGGVHFEFGKTKHKILGETRIFEFGINVNIQIAGS